jgi:hypothetical protein
MSGHFPAHKAFMQAVDVPLHLLKLVIDDRQPPGVPAEAQRVWNAMVAANPRLFNGPILSFDRLDGDELCARSDTYQRLVTHQPGVCHLAVTGVLMDQNSVLLGKRTGQTPVHPQAWEFVPSGGLDVPKKRAQDATIFWKQLLEEMSEEVGTGWQLSMNRVLGLVIDPTVPSADVVIVADVVSRGEASAQAWEHQELRWVRVEDLGSFVRTNACIPTVEPIACALAGIEIEDGAGG